MSEGGAQLAGVRQVSDPLLPVATGRFAATKLIMRLACPVLLRSGVGRRRTRGRR